MAPDVTLQFGAGPETNSWRVFFWIPDLPKLRGARIKLQEPRLREVCWYRTWLVDLRQVHGATARTLRMRRDKAECE